MPTNTYVALATTTLSSAASDITFSSISGAYTDLRLIFEGMAVSAGQDIYCQVNGDTATNYSHTRLTGNGTAASSSRGSSLAYMRFSDGGSPQTTNTSLTKVDFMNYSNTTTYKTVLNRADNANRGTDAVVNLWRSTAAITSIKFYISSGNIASGATATLYGIAASSVGAKATGGTIYSDSQYYYHVFGGSGTFTPTQSITADCLVVAGGGAGGYANGSSSGGGGAGGLRGPTSQSFTATAYTITVGAGGTSTSSPTYGGKGNTSSLIGGALSISGTGGGGGGGISDNGQQGGSGGGGSNNNQTAGAGNQGSYSPVEGFAGGAGAASNFSSGGGGGASAVGNPGPASGTGNTGGAGSSAYSTWASATSTGVSGSYAGGGGGGGGSANAAGGAGGGGTGGITATPQSGTAGTINTGSGGGGSQGTALVGGAGGSGIVIIRYAR